MLELYKNIRSIRKGKHMSQEELARLAGYTDRSSIAKIEKGDVDLPQSKIMLIASALGVDAGTLMGNTGIETRTLTPDESDLLDDYSLLNDLGKKKARDDVSDLTEIPRYKKTPDHLMPVAAHDRTDIDVTEEMIDEDDLLMEDDGIWKKD